ncbi:MAG TPA: extracellular solute-binding protein [Candidatus Paceibacterota bacterium]|nr:extracellular solute-binding protein [Candidatus Paceibacterota bacterium]
MKFRITLFQGIFLGVFALAAVIGLFVFATYTGSGGGNAIGTVTIWGTLPESQVQTALATIIRNDQTLKNVTYAQKDASTLPSELTAAIAAGTPPDLVLASQEELVPLSRFLAPIPASTLSARTFQNTFIGEGNLLAAADGYYGIPFLVDPLVLFSNNSILSSDGIATPPATWEALTGLVPKVAQLTDSRSVTRGLIALGTYANVHDARAILSTLFFQAGVRVSGRSAQTGQLIADLGTAASGVPPGQAVLGFYTQFADPTKVSYTWNASLPDSEQAFQNGDLGLYLGFASEARYLAQANPNLDFDVSPVPQPATAATKTGFGLLYSLMVPRSAPNPNGAYQTASKLAGDAAQAAFASATGLAPASRSALGSAPDDPIAAVAYAEALYANGWLSPQPYDTDTVFSDMIGNVISGRTTLQTALQQAQARLSAFLEQ